MSDKGVNKIRIEIEEEKEVRFRRISGPVGMLARLLAIVLPLYSFCYIMNFFPSVGMTVYAGTNSAIFLAAILALVFLLIPGSKSASKNRVPWYDFLFILISLFGSIYIAVMYESLLVTGGASITSGQLILGGLTILVLLEATRRTMGWSMIIIGMIFLAHAKFGYLLPGALHASEFSWGRVMTYLYLSNQGIFGMILEIAATLMIAFLTFGAFLNVCGAGQAFMKLSLALLGHVRGGPAKVSIIGSAMFGTVTGSPIAEIGVIGTFTIPLMKRIGYSPTFAGAIEAAAACGGVIDPPVMGAVAFVMADITGIGYGQICIAAIIPAVLYYLSIFFQLDLRAASSGLVGLPREQLPSIKEALAESWMLFLPIAALVTWMMVFMHEPTVAVYIALAVLILLGLPTKKRLTFRQFIDGLEKASLGMIEITPLCAIAGIIIGSLTLTGLGIKFSGLLVALSGGSMLMLAILTSAAIYIMGMGISSIATYILMGVMVAPALTQMGVPLLVAHFFIFYMTVSMFITPPYAPAAYVAAAVARASPLRVGYQAMKLAVVAYLVPFIIIFQPALLWQGPLLGIAQAAGTAVIAVFSLSVAFEGYCFTKARPLERLLWLAGGLLLFYPDALTDIVGVVVVAGGFLVQLLKRKRSKAALVEADHEA